MKGVCEEGGAGQEWDSPFHLQEKWAAERDRGCTLIGRRARRETEHFGRGGVHSMYTEESLKRFQQGSLVQVTLAAHGEGVGGRVTRAEAGGLHRCTWAQAWGLHLAGVLMERNR